MTHILIVLLLDRFLDWWAFFQIRVRFHGHFKVLDSTRRELVCDGFFEVFFLSRDEKLCFCFLNENQRLR
jgi:hypothetical protein